MSKKHIVLKYLFLLIALAINIFLIVNALLPGSESTEVSSPIVKIAADVVNTFSPNKIPTEPIPSKFAGGVRKFIGHFSLFLVNGIFSSLAIYYFKNQKLFKPILISISFGIFMAVLTELLQLIPKGRSCEINDMLIDFSGYFIGLVFVFVIIIIISFKKKCIAK